MPTMAALLMMVAWNMSEAPKAKHLLKTSPRSDIWVFLTCFSLTILFDMVIAITAGIILAALLFMKEMADMTKVSEIKDSSRILKKPVPDGWRLFKITGPLFFAAADKIFSELAILTDNTQGIIINMDGVSVLDAGGLSALSKFLAKCEQNKQELVLTDLRIQPLKALVKGGIIQKKGLLTFIPTLHELVDQLDLLSETSELRELEISDLGFASSSLTMG
jgi:SulP family sulfate permease